jgi:hypothetical protein
MSDKKPPDSKSLQIITWIFTESSLYLYGEVAFIQQKIMLKQLLQICSEMKPRKLISSSFIQ